MTNPLEAVLGASDAPRPIQTVDADPGVPGPRIVDYWSAPVAPQRWYFPDGTQYIEYLPLNHGQRKSFLHRTARHMEVEQGSKKAAINTDTSGDDDTLIELSAVDWLVYRGSNLVPFTKGSARSALTQFLAQADPKLIDSLAKQIRRDNPWMDSEITSDMIQEEIEELKKRLEEKIIEEGKKLSS